MTNLIAYPFRITNSGEVATLEEGEDYYAGELACLVQTRPGERILVPEYGMEDPAFGEFSRAELIEKIGMFGPPVVINDVETDVVADGIVSININYDASDEVLLDTVLNYYDESDEFQDEIYVIDEFDVGMPDASEDAA